MKDLCTGYIRRYLDDTLIDDDVFIDLMMTYIYDDTLKHMQKATSEREFRSNIFAMHGFKWCMQIIPNDDRYIKGSLYMSSLSPYITSITTIYHVEIPELNTVYTHFVYFTHYQYNNWIIPEETIKSDELQHIDSLSIKIRITMLNVFCERGQIWDNYLSFHPVSSKQSLEQFKWRLCNRKRIKNIIQQRQYECVISPIFYAHSFKWHLEFFPTGASEHDTLNTLYLRLDTFTKSIHKMDALCEIIIVETGTVFSRFKTFSSVDTLVCCSLSKMMNLTFTLIVNIYLIDIYDRGYNLITDNFSLNPSQSMIATEPMLYEWEISNYNFIQNRKVWSEFSSVFTMYSMKWYLQISKVKAKGDITLRICLCIKPNISNVVLKYKVILEESTDHHEAVVSFTDYDHSQKWPTFTSKQIDPNANRLRFKVFISLIDVFEKQNGTNVTDTFLINANHIKADIVNADEYIWKINSVQKNVTFDVCKAYISAYYHKFVENKVIALCAQYLHYDGMESINNAKNTESVKSDIFLMNGFKWMIKFYPKGINIKEERYIDLILYLISFPSNIKRMITTLNVTIDEIDTVYSETHSIESGGCSLSLIPSKSMETDVIRNLKHVTIKINVAIIDIFDKNGKSLNEMPLIMDPSSLNLYPPYDIFTWNIVDKDSIKKMKSWTNREMLFSPCFSLFGFKWFLELDPEDSDSVVLYLNITAIPPNISSIHCHYELVFQQKGIKDSDFVVFTSDNKCVGYKYDKLEISELENLRKLTFIANITLIDVYDCDNNIITDEFVNKSILQLLPKERKTKIWNIDNLKLLPNAVSYESDIMFISSFKWKMELYCNGFGPDTKDNINVFLYLTSMSPLICKVCIHYKIELVGLNEFFAESQTILHSETQCFASIDYVAKSYKLKNVDSLRLKLDIISIDSFHKNGNVFYYNKSVINSPLKSNVLKWILPRNRFNDFKTAQNGSEICSECFIAHCLNWNIVLYPNGVNDGKSFGQIKIKLRLNELPKGIQGVSCRFKLEFKEINIKYCNYFHFNKDNLSLIARENSDFRKLFVMNWKQCTIEAEITLIDVYDKEGTILQFPFL